MTPRSRTVLVLFFFCLCRHSPVQAQDYFIAYDSLATPGYNILPTPAGGVIVQEYITRGTNSTQPRLSLLKLDKAGNVSWEHVYQARLQAQSPNSHKPINSTKLRRGSDESIIGVGGIALVPFSQTPIIVKFAPSGEPLWSRTIAPENENGWLEDVVEISGEDAIASGLFLRESILLGDSVQIGPDNRLVKDGQRVSFIGDFLARFANDGSITWAKELRYDFGTLDNHYLFYTGAKPGMIGTLQYDDRDTNEPMLLLSFDRNGTVLRSEVIHPVPTSPAVSRTALQPYGVYFTDAYSIVYGTVQEWIPNYQEDPFQKQTHQGYTTSFIIKMDRDNKVLWSKRIHPSQPLNRFSLTVLPETEDIIITSSDRNAPATMIRLSSTGEFQEAVHLAKSMGKFRFTHNPADVRPLEHYTINAITATTEGRIAGLCVVQTPIVPEDRTVPRDSIVWYQSGVFQVSPSIDFHCGQTKKLSVEIKNLALRREQFAVRTVPITEYGQNQLTIDMEPHTPSLRELCKPDKKDAE